ncbi:MAG: hypothetical protein KAU38_17070 [Desulfobacterales bacterium]|nr:hypothetical protein [Desulfobacterales bacterium]
MRHTFQAQEAALGHHRRSPSKADMGHSAREARDNSAEASVTARHAKGYHFKGYVACHHQRLSGNKKATDDDFTPENVILRTQNTHFWNVYP